MAHSDIRFHVKVGFHLGLICDDGLSEASETESSSGVSGNEAGRSFTKRCRFGKTALETIPGTPAAGASLQMMSPPGL